MDYRPREAVGRESIRFIYRTLGNTTSASFLLSN